YTVTSPSDAALRYAVEQSNMHPGTTPNIINFSLSGSGVHTIHLIGTLQLTAPVTIDATSQPGYAGTPVVVLDGLESGPQTDAIDIMASGCTVRGLDIAGVHGTAIALYGNRNTIAGNFLGTDPSGTTAVPNDANDIAVLGANNTIGGTTAADRNVISGIAAA